MPVFNVDQELDDLSCEFALIDDNQRHKIRRSKTTRSVRRGYTDAAGSEGFDHLQRAAPNISVRIDSDRALLKERMDVLDEIEHGHARLIKTCVPRRNDAPIVTSENP